MARIGRAVHWSFWYEIAGAMLSLILAVVTLLWHDWLEVLFRTNPDSGSGLLEWTVVVACFATTTALSALARCEWRRAALAWPASQIPPT